MIKVQKNKFNGPECVVVKAESKDRSNSDQDTLLIPEQGNHLFSSSTTTGSDITLADDGCPTNEPQDV